MKIFLIFLVFIHTSTRRKRKYNYDHQIIDIRENHEVNIRASNEFESTIHNEKLLKNDWCLKEPVDYSYKKGNTSLNDQTLNYNLVKDKIKPEFELEHTQMDFTADYILLNEPLDLRIKRPKIDLSLIEKTENVLPDNPYHKQHLSTELNNYLILDTEIQELDQKDTTIDFISSQMTEICKKIMRYMEGAFNIIQFDYYTSKLTDINSIYDFLYQNNHCYRHNNDIFKLFDLKLIEILQEMLFKFGKNVQFTKKNYLKFITRLFYNIHSTNEFSNFKAELKCMKDEKLKYIFYSEYMNCVKYFVIVPELMTLGLIYSNRSIYDLIISIRLINLLLDKKKFAGDDTVFALFLVKKAFTSVNKNTFDFFSIHNFRGNCLVYNHNLHFFLWEMNGDRRKYLKKKLTNKTTYCLSGIDKIHLKSVLLIFLYQQMLFLKFYNVCKIESKKYLELIDLVITKNNCVSCDFNNFIELLKSFN